MQSTGKEKFTCYVYFKTKAYKDGDAGWESSDDEDGDEGKEDEEEESSPEN